MLWWSLLGIIMPLKYPIYPGLEIGKKDGRHGFNTRSDIEQREDLKGKYDYFCYMINGQALTDD
jgi:hypothetical protein